MKTRFLLIGLILIVGVLLAGFGLDFARAQGEQVTASNYPVMNWERVSEYGFGHPDGFIGGTTSLEVFNDALFAGPAATPNGTAVYRTEDGMNWVQVSEVLFGQPTPEPELECGTYWWYIWDMVVFDGQLYATAGYCCVDANWSYWGGMIFRSPDGFTWEPVVTDAFGYPGHQAVNILTVFDNMIYAGTANLTDGLRIYRSDTGNMGDWEEVTPANLANPIHYYANDFQVYHDTLFMNTNVITSSETSGIWYTSDGVNWEDGPLDIFICETDPACGGGGLEVFNDTLYMDLLAFGSPGELWSTNNGLTWTLNATTGDSKFFSLTPMAAYKGYLYLGLNEESWAPGKLWRTMDGVTFENASKPGFDLTSGAAILPNGAAVFQDHLYLSKFNWDLGGSIWRDAPFYTWVPWISK